MDKKIKLIVIAGLAVVLGAAAFFILQMYSANKALEQEMNGLKSENAVLSRKIEEISEERKQLSGRLNALNSDLSRVSDEKDNIQKQYASIIKERDSLSEDIKTLQANNDKLRAELGALNQEKERLGKDLEGNLAPLKKENEKLAAELEELKAAKSKMEAELWQLIDEKTSFEDKLGQIDAFLRQRLSEAEYATLKEQIDGIVKSVTGTPESDSAVSMEETVELPPIVVKPKSDAETPLGWLSKKRAPAKPTGTVLEVDRQNGFVIIDLGQEAGINVGDAFRVYRQGNPIATVSVIQLRQSISACDISQEGTLIEKGDIVRE